ncbi:Uncharacterized protein FKW44_020322 [Caligus rogercresseyi]|uniref:Ribosome assembly protein 1 n=1 Tax=Caligus rogercresseyi TaxID=217165 RepID=A0A7T8GX60_CALRO|nr:Uncharacterized protein FKW44_020322 [Caligus rogercresseyi]
MPRQVPIEKLKSLQEDPSRIRNICILAHVDHGKTTLADSLLASNGIISPRLCGSLRYLDSRPDEQARGITMKSSAVTLSHKEHLIHLIDSPGHVDFSSEVSTAVRLSDGALLLIDVVEGVQPQTRAVLQQVWSEGIRPILLLNKMDRLISETQMTPLDAYIHLSQILEQANAIIGELFSTSVLEGEEALIHDADDSGIYFSPDAGNVLFASAFHGWAFSISSFAAIYSQKLGFSEETLRRTLWGDYYLNPKAQKILKGALSKAKKPLFVQLILESLWSVYESIIRKDELKLEKILASLALKIHPRDLRSNEVRQRLNAIMGAWIPLSQAVLDTVISHLPSPLELTEVRVEHLMSSLSRPFAFLPQRSKDLKDNFLKCSASEEAPVIVFVSKMVPVPSKQLPENRPRPLTAEEIALKRETARASHALRLKQSKEENTESHVCLSEDQMSKLNIKDDLAKTDPSLEDEEKTVFIAFARVFSGRLTPGRKIYVLGPKHDPSLVERQKMAGEPIFDPSSNLKSNNPGPIMEATIGNLYLLLGRDLEECASVPPGNVIGIGGLADFILKSATLSSDILTPPFIEMSASSAPILRQVVKGLHLLNQADANVQVLITDKGEHLLVTAGEVHLERCLKDLKEVTLNVEDCSELNICFYFNLQETYAGIDINVSEPMVPFRETIVKPPEMDMVNEQIELEEKSCEDWVEIETPDKQSTIRMRSVPLPIDVIKLLENVVNPSYINSSTTIAEFCKEIDALFEADTLSKEFGLSSNKIWSIGPKKSPTNLLFVAQDGVSFMEGLSGGSALHKSYSSSFLNGFQMASGAGPLCDEPMRGVGFIVEEWRFAPEEDSPHSLSYGPLSGQIISTTKEACRSAFQAQPMRLMAGMYTCDIHVKAEVLGKMYAVLGKRHGKVVKESMIEGSSTFVVTANLPVVESMDFCNVIRKQTSGLAMPQLVFSHWEVIEVDPFWVPATEEELLHFGDKADSANIARNYMNDVRKKKGLVIDEKIVEHAEKQRTISKKK